MGENKGNSIGMMATIALVVSEVWIVSGYVANLYGAMTAVGYDIWFLAFTGVVTVANLLLIPFVVKENKWAFLAAMIVGVVLFLVMLTVGPVYTLLTTSWQSTMDYLTAVVGGIVWLILQIPVIFFSFRAYRKV